MCGIAGFLNLDQRPADPTRVAAMCQRIRHRGPDGDGVYCQGPIGLGHRRLSIIDLEGGRQPMSNEDGTVWVTFNGEIYNFAELHHALEGKGHRFRTRSDTEVLVHAWEEWGERCVDRLRGMFAFAIWDSPRQQLFLARDRVGIKPLYYLHQPGLFAFASELQAFDALPDFDASIDLDALDLYFQFQYIPAPFSIFRNVRKLPPAHTVTVDAGRGPREPKRYWQLDYSPDHRPSEGEWLERLDAGLRETVGTHLVSDVEFGAFLSGGLDSSTVVAYMSQSMDRPVKTFSIRFDEGEFDEGRYAREVAALFGTEHHEEFVRPDALEVLPELVRHYGEPFADSSSIPTYYVSRMTAPHVKMVLSGDGGDELFAGYSRYEGLLHEHRTPDGLVASLRHSLGNVARATGLRPAMPSPRDTWYRSIATFDEASRARLWLGGRAPGRSAVAGWYEAQCDALPRADLCTQYQHLDTTTFLPYDILTKVDVASMAHGLEVRVPLLDHRFMELVATIPSSLKLRGAAGQSLAPMTGKYLLKRNAERFFTRDFIYRKKRGFEVPIRNWFDGPLRRELSSRLVDRDGGLRDYLDLGYVRTLIDEHGAGADNTVRLWTLLFLSEWLSARKQESLAPA